MEDRNVGILKALSRDQLGIQPSKWQFDPSSLEPLIGSGTYRLVKEGADWFLKVNASHPNAKKVSFEKWKLIFFANPKYELPSNTFPDYLPYISKTIRDTLEKNPKFPKNEFNSHEQLSFSQTSIWWNPHGQHFKSETYLR